MSIVLKLVFCALRWQDFKMFQVRESIIGTLIERKIRVRIYSNIKLTVQPYSPLYILIRQIR